MGFKSIEQFNEERYGNKFILPNDGDFADVIFLYKSAKEVLVADAHYVKSADYSGYVHCNGGGCPACVKGIRVQNKLFIPIYNITENEIQFWDRTINFEPQLHADVFSKYPNPSEYVFRITRQGAARDINTKYQIIAIANNNVKSYDEIVSENNAKFPDYYKNICKDVDAITLSGWINTINSSSTAYSSSELPKYAAIPRVTPTVSQNAMIDIDEIVDESTDEEIDTPVDFN